MFNVIQIIGLQKAARRGVSMVIATTNAAHATKAGTAKGAIGVSDSKNKSTKSDFKSFSSHKPRNLALLISYLLRILIKQLRKKV